jgi:hypothetical protein
LAREAYFLEFARTLRRRLTMPIMLTGGLRTRQGMRQALAEGIDLLGVARPFCVDPVGAAGILFDEVDLIPSWEEKLRREKGLLSNNSPLAIVRTVTSFAGIYWFYEQVYRLGRGEAAKLNALPLAAMARVMLTERGIEKKRKAARQATLRPAVKPDATSLDQIMARRRLQERRPAGT